MTTSALALFLVVIAVFAVAFAAMALGVMLSGRCLRGSCGGAEAIGPAGEKLTCAGCPNRRNPRAAPRGKPRAAQSPASQLLVHHQRIDEPSDRMPERRG